MLCLSQHPGPEGHVREIPAGGVGLRVPREPPDVTHPEPRGPGQGTGVPCPGRLRAAVVCERDRRACRLPDRTGAPRAAGVVLAAGTRELREVGGSRPDDLRGGKEGVLKDRVHERNAAPGEVSLQRHDRVGELPVMAVYVDQVSR